jgi:hypothetical protein
MSLTRLFALVGLLFGLLSTAAHAQSSPHYNDFQARNSFHFELGGRAIPWSLNYERRYILNETTRWAFQLGVGNRMGEPNMRQQRLGLDSSNLMFPLSLHLMKGRSRHQLEVGLGVTVQARHSIRQGNVRYPRLERGSRLAGAALIGYRFHPHLSGPVFRLFYSPLYQYLNRPPDQSNGFHHNFGLSVGWALQNVKVK